MSPTTLTPGTRLGPFEILSSLGEGGMGAVYRARDTKLSREVAIKVLLPAVANDADRLARFQREAQVLASLNHPHIAAIYGLEDADGTKALVLELVEGPTLADRIAQGAIPLDEALPIAKQIAEALEAAHEQGIIHRDLKPANIKVRADGAVKVLDFGLAKAMDPAGASSANAMNSPTLSMHATQAGIILGTAAYMSPEQARGKAVDKRADLWAYGVVLFEMLTGRRAFNADDISATLAFVITKDPDWSALPANTPSAIRRLLRRCLEKDPKRRLQAIGDARLELDDAVARADEEKGPPVPVRARSRALVGAISLASVALLALAVLTVRQLLERPAQLPEIRFDVPAPILGFGGGGFALSPDGRALVFRGAELQLWLRSLDAPAARPLEGSAGGINPTFSPDGRSIVFALEVKDAWEVRRASTDGSRSTRIATVPQVSSLSWGASDVILVTTEKGIGRIPAGGGDLVTVIPAESGAAYLSAAFLPDGKHFVYVSRRDMAAYVASLDSPTGTRLFSPATSAQYVEPGYLLAGDGQTVYGYPFDAKRSRLSGDRFPVLQSAASFSAAFSGAIAFRSPSTGGLVQLEWMSRAGQVIAPVGPALPNANELEIAPDGRHAVTVRYVDGQYDLWLVELARGVLTRLTSTPALSRWPTWSPDSRRVAYAEADSLYVTDADGAGTTQPLLEDAFVKQPSDWSPDGRFLIYRVQSKSRPKGDLWVLPLGGDRTPFPFVATEWEETRAQFSPDGRWVAYESDESGRHEIYVRPFQRPGGRVSISVEGGIEARWSPSGREVVFINPAGAFMSAAVQPSADGSSLDVAAPLRLFQGRLLERGVYPPDFKTNYDVSPAGDRFLVLQTTENADARAITVVANWQPSVVR